MLEKPSEYIPQGRLKEFSGDASKPESAGLRFIAVLVSDNKANTDGGTIFKKWKASEDSYKMWYNNSFGKMNLWLGNVNSTQVQSDTVVVQLLCKHNEEIDYTALEKAIDLLGKEAAKESGSVHLNKMENWDVVSKIIEAKLLKRGLNVNVYG